MLCRAFCNGSVWFVDQFRKGKEFFLRKVPWYSKKNITFSDMLAAARRSHLSQGFLVERGAKQNKPKTTFTRFTRRPDSQKRAKL
jgi:hypothetical protein